MSIKTQNEFHDLGTKAAEEGDELTARIRFAQRDLEELGDKLAAVVGDIENVASDMLDQKQFAGVFHDVYAVLDLVKQTMPSGASWGPIAVTQQMLQRAWVEHRSREEA